MHSYNICMYCLNAGATKPSAEFLSMSMYTSGNKKHKFGFGVITFFIGEPINITVNMLTGIGLKFSLKLVKIVQSTHKLKCLIKII